VRSEFVQLIVVPPPRHEPAWSVMFMSPVGVGPPRQYRF
jgi:hypothetical protein